MPMNFKPSPLALKISLVTFAVSILWTILGSGALLYLEYNNNKKEGVERLKEVCEVHSAGLSQSLWDYDSILLKTQLRALVDLPTVSFGQVKGQGQSSWQAGSEPARNVRSLSFPLSYSDRGDIVTLGSLEVTPDFAPLHNDLLSLAFKILVSQAINSFVIVILFLFLFYFLAGRHLAEIASQASLLTVDNLDIPIQLSRNAKGPVEGDELDVLEKSLNDMRTNLVEAFSTIRISEERHRKLFETMVQGVVYQDSGGAILSANPAALHFFGLKEKHFSKPHSSDLLWDCIREDGTQITKEKHPAMIAMATGKRVMDHVIGVRDSVTNEYCWLRVNSIPLFDESSQNPYQVHTTFEDITERRKARETLERYATIISATNDMMYFVDENCRYQAANRAYLQFYDKKSEDVIGYTVEEVAGEQSYNQYIKERFTGALNGEKSNFQAWLYYPKAGKRYMDVTLSPFRNSHDQVTGAVATVHDLTELKNAEDALRSSEEELRDLIENINDVIYALDKNGIITYLSPRIGALMGYAPTTATGLDFFDLAHPKDILKVKEHIIHGLAGKVSPCEFRAKNKVGETIWIRSSHHPVFDGDHVNGVRGTLTDITEQKALEAQLFQTQKMDAIGQLAGGIAHDFNNLLGGIMGATEILSMKVKDEESVKKYINMILSSSERAAGMTSKLLTFSRNSPNVSTKVDVHQIINDTVTLLSNSIDRRIKLISELHADESMVVGDPSQLQNVFLNLGINSSHAMAEGGEIVYSTKLIVLDQADCDASSFDLNPGPHLGIEVKDTGIGIPLENQQEIFEPFFTTKEQGKGTGLGLASSYGAIRQHHGSITVHSEKGVGTSFYIILPLASGVGGQFLKIAEKIQGRGHILVVDDDEMMRSTARIILEDLGYSVETANDGKDAIEKYLNCSTPYDLVVLDMIMPLLNGRDCFKELKVINPEVKVVLSSGFSQEKDVEKLKSSGLKGFIGKPYRSVTLSKIIHDALQ